VNATIQRHLEARRLEERAADNVEVLGFWGKALEAYTDARNSSSSLDNRFLRAYDAGRIAAVALVRAAGYRVRGGEGHHYVTFDVARTLAEDPELRRALEEMNGLRTLRHDVEYEYEDDVGAEAVGTALRVAERVINLGAKHLRVARPALEKRIRMVRSPEEG
jgi:hypothetical protein